MNTIVHSAHMDIFQNLSVDLENEGRYLFLNAIANQLRYPNSLTNYFSCVLLYLFVEANSEAIQVSHRDIRKRRRKNLIPCFSSNSRSKLPECLSSV